MEIVCMAEQIRVIENILRNGKRMWGGGWENCKDGGKTYNKGKTEIHVDSEGFDLPQRGRSTGFQLLPGKGCSIHWFL